MEANTMGNEINMVTIPEGVRWREGVLYINAEPKYIVRHVLGNGNEQDYVAVFQVDSEIYERSKGQRIEKRVSILPQRRFTGGSFLANLGNQMLEQRAKRTPPKFRTDPPIYVSTVQQGVGTFTNKKGAGFKEYTPDKVDVNLGKFVRGIQTGVFILLDDIEWGEYKLSLEHLVRSVEHPEGKVTFHDLS